MCRTALDHRILIMLLYLAAFTSIDIAPGEGSALNSSAQETLTPNIYLPWNVELKDIDTIKGLTHFVTTFNGTLVADIQGCNIKNPEVTLGYKLCPVPYQPAISPLDQRLQACTQPMDHLLLHRPPPT